MPTDPEEEVKRLEELLLLTPGSANYDLAPFLTAPAVQKVTETSGNTPVVIHVPETEFPSPLAPNLGPQIIKGLHDHLCGVPNSNSTRQQKCGDEIWLSWKRAWDLWNNHYIEGRESPVWIRGEYAKLKGQFEREREEERLARQEKMSFAPHSQQSHTVRPYLGRKTALVEPDLIERDHARREKNIKARGLKAGSTTTLYNEGVFTPIVDKNVLSYTKGVEPIAQKPPRRSLKTYDDLRKQGKRKNKVSIEEKHAIITNPTTTKFDFFSTVAGPTNKDVLEDTDLETNHLPAQDPVEDAHSVSITTDGRGGESLQASKSPRATREGKEKIDVSTTMGTYSAPSKTAKRWKHLAGQSRKTNDPATGGFAGNQENDTQSYFPDDIITIQDKGCIKATPGEEGKDVKLDPTLGRRQLNVSKTIRSSRHFLRDTNERRQRICLPDSKHAGADYDQEANSTAKRPEDIDQESFNFSSDSSGYGSNEDGNSDTDSDDSLSVSQPFRSFTDNLDAPIPIPDASEVIEVDGSSGGFLPMKLLPEYLEPIANADGRIPELEDAIQNSVWRPRWVGEKTLKIDIDQSIEGFLKNTDLEIFGGVDCGRSPYPVLRAVTKYINYRHTVNKDSNDVLMKKKVWDGVTGTLFNMPSKPLEGNSESANERLIRMKKFYGDHYRDERDQPNSGIFPLDIRRVKRYDADFLRSKEATDLLGPGEAEILQPWRNPVTYYHEMPSDDPWWVTSEQETLRDVPPRTYPPRDCKSAPDLNKGKLLYTDDTLWKEEVENDELHHSVYFVTNLHGGTLLINGIEVKKGCIAGPLPAFAVIECPGNQIAFWFGPGGRYWNEGSANTDQRMHWDTLRQMPGWEYVGLSAGQVWNTIIRDRLRRELTGNKLEDDENWELWKSAEPIQQVLPPTGPMVFPHLRLDVRHEAPYRDKVPWDIACVNVEPECFRTEEDEIRWLRTRVLPLKTAADRVATRLLRYPDPEYLWAIDENDVPITFDEISLQTRAELEFESSISRILRRQRQATKWYKKVREERETKIRSETRARNLKRQKNNPFPQPQEEKTKSEFDDVSGWMKQESNPTDVTNDERIWQEYLASEAGRERAKETNNSAGEAGADSLASNIDHLQELWEAANARRVKGGLPPFSGPSPQEQAEKDAIRLPGLIKTYTTAPQAAKQKRVQDRKDAKAAKEKVKQKAAQMLQAKKDERHQKRKALDNLVADEDELRAKRLKYFLEIAVEKEKEATETKLEAQKVADAARINAALQGRYVPGISRQADIPTNPEKYQPELEPTPKIDQQAPSLTENPTKAPQDSISNTKRVQHPKSLKAPMPKSPSGLKRGEVVLGNPSILNIREQSAIVREAVAKPRKNSILREASPRLNNNKSSKKKPIEARPEPEAAIKKRHDVITKPRAARKTTIAKKLQEGVQNLFKREGIDMLKTYNERDKTPSSGRRKTRRQKSVSGLAAQKRGYQEKPKDGTLKSNQRNNQQQKKKKQDKQTSAKLVAQTPVHTAHDGNDRTNDEHTPTSLYFHHTQWISQKELCAQSEQDQLETVLNYQLWQHPKAPKCVQHDAVLNRASSAGLTLSEYLKQHNYTDLGDYLSAQVVPDVAVPREMEAIFVDTGYEEPEDVMSLLYTSCYEEVYKQAQLQGITLEQYVFQQEPPGGPNIDVEDYIGILAAIKGDEINQSPTGQRREALSVVLSEFSNFDVANYTAKIEHLENSRPLPALRDTNNRLFCEL